jgi:anti-anti-sigma regulatory factor
VGVFLSHLDDVKNLGGRFVFCNMSTGVFSIFEILGLHNMIDIVNEQEEAQKIFDES